jgi:hypothetical protein
MALSLGVAAIKRNETAARLIEHTVLVFCTHNHFVAKILYCLSLLHGFLDAALPQAISFICPLQ